MLTYIPEYSIFKLDRKIKEKQLIRKIVSIYVERSIVMTVIYSDFGDTDTKVLKNIWKDLDVKEVRLTTNGNISMKKINKAIYDEEDTIIFCGHGSGEGCWNPSWNSGEFYTLSARNLRFLRAKKVIGIWCHASDFSKKYDVPGFFSYMFISNPGEAKGLGITGVPFNEITKSEIKFCNILNDLLKKDVPLSEWRGVVLDNMDASNPVEEFNYSQVYYKE